MFTAETQLRVRYAETDQMGVVYYGNYAQYFEVGRAESIRDMGYTYKDMEIDGIIMPVVEMHIKYLRPAKYDDLITIKSEIRELPITHKITFHQQIFNENNELLCNGFVSLFFMETATMQRRQMPEKLFALIKPFYN